MDDAPSGAELRARFRGSSDLLAQDAQDALIDWSSSDDFLNESCIDETVAIVSTFQLQSPFPSRSTPSVGGPAWHPSFNTPLLLAVDELSSWLYDRSFTSRLNEMTKATPSGSVLDHPEETASSLLRRINCFYADMASPLICPEHSSSPMALHFASILPSLPELLNRTANVLSLISTAIQGGSLSETQETSLLNDLQYLSSLRFLHTFPSQSPSTPSSSPLTTSSSPHASSPISLLIPLLRGIRRLLDPLQEFSVFLHEGLSSIKAKCTCHNSIPSSSTSTSSSSSTSTSASAHTPSPNHLHNDSAIPCPSCTTTLSSPRFDGIISLFRAFSSTSLFPPLHLLHASFSSFDRALQTISSLAQSLSSSSSWRSILLHFDTNNADRKMSVGMGDQNRTTSSSSTSSPSPLSHAIRVMIGDLTNDDSVSSFWRVVSMLRRTDTEGDERQMYDDTHEHINQLHQARLESWEEEEGGILPGFSVCLSIITQALEQLVDLLGGGAINKSTPLTDESINTKAHDQEQEQDQNTLCHNECCLNISPTPDNYQPSSSSSSIRLVSVNHSSMCPNRGISQMITKAGARTMMTSPPYHITTTTPSTATNDDAAQSDYSKVSVAIHGLHRLIQLHCLGLDVMATHSQQFLPVSCVDASTETPSSQHNPSLTRPHSSLTAPSSDLFDWVTNVTPSIALSVLEHDHPNQPQVDQSNQVKATQPSNTYSHRALLLDCLMRLTSSSSSTPLDNLYTWHSSCRLWSSLDHILSERLLWSHPSRYTATMDTLAGLIAPSPLPSLSPPTSPPPTIPLSPPTQIGLSLLVLRHLPLLLSVSSTTSTKSPSSPPTSNHLALLLTTSVSHILKLPTITITSSTYSFLFGSDPPLVCSLYRSVIATLTNTIASLTSSPLHHSTGVQSQLLSALLSLLFTFPSSSSSSPLLTAYIVASTIYPLFSTLPGLLNSLILNTIKPYLTTHLISTQTPSLHTLPLIPSTLLLLPPAFSYSLAFLLPNLSSVTLQFLIDPFSFSLPPSSSHLPSPASHPVASSSLIPIPLLTALLRQLYPTTPPSSPSPPSTPQPSLPIQSFESSLLPGLIHHSLSTLISLTSCYTANAHNPPLTPTKSTTPHVLVAVTPSPSSLLSSTSTSSIPNATYHFSLFSTLLHSNAKEVTLRILNTPISSSLSAHLVPSPPSSSPLTPTLLQCLAFSFISIVSLFPTLAHLSSNSSSIHSSTLSSTFPLLGLDNLAFIYSILSLSPLLSTALDTSTSISRLTSTPPDSLLSSSSSSTSSSTSSSSFSSSSPITTLTEGLLALHLVSIKSSDICTTLLATVERFCFDVMYSNQQSTNRPTSASPLPPALIDIASRCLSLEPVKWLHSIPVSSSSPLTPAASDPSITTTSPSSPIPFLSSLTSLDSSSISTAITRAQSLFNHDVTPSTSESTPSALSTGRIYSVDSNLQALTSSSTLPCTAFILPSYPTQCASSLASLVTMLFQSLNVIIASSQSHSSSAGSTSTSSSAHSLSLLPPSAVDSVMIVTSAFRRLTRRVHPSLINLLKPSVPQFLRPLLVQYLKTYAEQAAIIKTV